MNTLCKVALAGLIGASALTFMTTGASARVVCNADGDCWHTRTEYVYRPEFGLTIHPDNWRWKDGERFTWREHEGRGYWHGGQWREF